MSDKKGGISFMVYAVSLIVVLLIGAGAAGYMWFDGQQQLSVMTTAHEQDLVDAQKAAEALQAQVDAARTKAAKLGARVEVARAHENLQQMNYGLVGKHLTTASQHLEGVEGGAPIAGRLSSTNIDPASPEAAQGMILALAGELDALLKE
ncbi:MAG: hypothetical protein AB8H79_25175 [Myxococcota bacterium]